MENFFLGDSNALLCLARHDGKINDTRDAWDHSNLIIYCLRFCVCMNLYVNCYPRLLYLFWSFGGTPLHERMLSKGVLVMKVRS